MVRYEAGETLASIARTYDCSPPAISYIVSRSRARQPGAAAPIAAAEPQLLKAPEGEAAPRPIAPATAAASHAEGPGAPRAVPPAAAAPRSAEVAASGESRGNGPLTVALNGNGTAFRNGSTGSHERDAGFPGLPPRAVAPRPAPPSHAAAGPYNGVSAHPNGDRRTLHLSLGGNGGSNGAAHGNGPGPASANGSSGHATAERVEPSPPSSQPSSQRAAEDDRPLTRGSQPGRYGYPGDSLAERSLAPAPNQRREAQGRGAQGREASGTFIDGELRARVDADIAAFLAAFDGALAADTPDSRVALREATDRLLRAGARTRIELERLEARIPLAPRDSGRPDAAWRAR